nr:MAG: ORF2 [Giant panda anellovirus]
MGTAGEEIWIETIRLSHQLFCSCDNFKDHLLKIWQGTGAVGIPEEDAIIPEDILVDFDLGFEESAAGEDRDR